MEADVSTEIDSEGIAAHVDSSFSFQQLPIFEPTSAFFRLWIRVNIIDAVPNEVN